MGLRRAARRAERRHPRDPAAAARIRVGSCRGPYRPVEMAHVDLPGCLAGGYVLPLKRAVREAEGIGVDGVIAVWLEVLDA